MRGKYRMFQLLKHMQYKDAQPNNACTNLILITYTNFYILIAILIPIYLLAQKQKELVHIPQPLS